MNKIFQLVTMPVLISLTSCAPISQITTNLDQDNFVHYFAPGKVEIIEDKDLHAKKTTLIGAVEGESCQESSLSAPADIIEARTKARRAAYFLNANAIIFSGCTTITTKQCYANIICYGKAYQIEEHSK